MKRLFLVLATGLLLLNACGQVPLSTAQQQVEQPDPQTTEVTPHLSSQSVASFLIKKGVVRATKAQLRQAISEAVQTRLRPYGSDPIVKSIVRDADDALAALEDPWWVTAVGFIPVVGDALDLARVPVKIANAVRKAEDTYMPEPRGISANTGHWRPAGTAPPQEQWMKVFSTMQSNT